MLRILLKDFLFEPDSQRGLWTQRDKKLTTATGRITQSFLWYITYIEWPTLDFAVNLNIVRFCKTRINPIETIHWPQPRGKKKAG